jgi:hypothetical protein
VSAGVPAKTPAAQTSQDMNSATGERDALRPGAVQQDTGTLASDLDEEFRNLFGGAATGRTIFDGAKPMPVSWDGLGSDPDGGLIIPLGGAVTGLRTSLAFEHAVGWRSLSTAAGDSGRPHPCGVHRHTEAQSSPLA